MDKKVEGVPAHPTAHRCCGGDDRSQLRERPHLWSLLSPRVRLFLRGLGFQAAVSQPELLLQAEPSCGAGLPAHQLCHLHPTWLLPAPSPHGASPGALFWWSLGPRGQVAFSLCLPWSSLLSGWCCPTPMSLGYICLFLFFYINAPGPVPTTTTPQSPHCG